MRQFNFTKNSKPIKLEPFFSNFSQIQKSNHLDFNYNYERLFGSKLEFRGTRSQNALFQKIQNFIKSERFKGFFSNSIRNVFEH